MSDDAIYDGATKKIQIQHGDETDILDDYGVVGEPLWAEDTKKLWVHDGTEYVPVTIGYVSQNDEPTLTAGEVALWRDADASQVFLVFNDPTEGQVKVELT